MITVRTHFKPKHKNNVCLMISYVTSYFKLARETVLKGLLGVLLSYLRISKGFTIR